MATLLEDCRFGEKSPFVDFVGFGGAVGTVLVHRFLGLACGEHLHLHCLQLHFGLGNGEGELT